MHWDIRQARTFITVAEELSFSSAARKLNTTQSAVSRTVSQMEADLKVPLLSRTTRNVVLTPEGQLLLSECREVVEQFDRWIRRARRLADGTSGQIGVGLNDFAILGEVPGLLNGFRAAFPDVEFRFFSEIRDMTLWRLDRREVDVGFVMGPLTHPRYHTVVSAEYQLNCLVHRDHPLARYQSVTVEQLAEKPLILGPTRTWRTYRNFLQHEFDRTGTAMNVIQEVDDSVAIFGLVAGGSGITLYPDCQNHIQLRDVVSIPVVGLEHNVQTVLIWSDDYISEAGRNFVRFVLDRSQAAV
ncbi:MAG: LysR family transcriptional regulator [Hyphomicrobiales bacterium]